jgi:GNAT superfamily N-acetyltransferase
MPVREARLPEDESAILSFMQGLQEYEAAFESDRRLDPEWAQAHWCVVQDRYVRQHGIVLLAEDDKGIPVGWAFAHDQTGEAYMVAHERHHGYLAELYIMPSARGHGHGRALIEACEAWARERGHKILTVGVLAANARAIRAYEDAGFTPYSLTMRRYL